MSLSGRIDAVVIGASAGGVQAVSMLLPAFTADLPASVFIVLHVPRDKPSMLPEVFGRKCALPVLEAEDKLPIEFSKVYVAPSNYHMLIDEGPQLALSADDPVHHSRPSIDVLFESAAPIYRDRLMGIILTGANADGAVGLAAVHDAGGMTVVQEPESAQSPVMVRAALKLRPGHLVLPLQQIAAMLASIRVVE